MASRKSILSSEAEETVSDSPRRRSSRIANAPVTVKPAAPVGRRRSSASEATPSPAPAKIALTKRPSLSHEIQIASPRAKRSESKSPTQELTTTTTRRASLSKAVELEAKTRPASPATMTRRRSLRGQSTSPTREDDTSGRLTRGRKGSLSQANQLEAIVEADALPKKRGRAKANVDEPVKKDERTPIRRSMRLRSGSVDAPEETEEASKLPLTMSAINEEENEPVQQDVNDSKDKNESDEGFNDVTNNDDTTNIQKLEKPQEDSVLKETNDTENAEIDKAQEENLETDSSKPADHPSEILKPHSDTHEVNENKDHMESVKANEEELSKVNIEQPISTPEISEETRNDDLLSADELELHVEDDKAESPSISARTLSNSTDGEQHSKESDLEDNKKLAITDLTKSSIDLELKTIRRSPRLSASPSRSNSPSTRSPLRSSPRLAKMRSDSCDSSKSAEITKSPSVESDKTSPTKLQTATDTIAVSPEVVEQMDVDETPEDVFVSPVKSPYVKLERKSLSFSENDSNTKCEENDTPKSTSSPRKASLGLTPKSTTPKSTSSLNESVDAGMKDEFASDGSSFHLNISIPPSTDSESFGDKSRVETALNSSGSSVHSDKENNATKLNTPRSANKRVSLTKVSTPAKNVIVVQTEISKELTPLKSINDSNIIEIDEVTECGTSPMKRPKSSVLSMKVVLSDDEVDVLQEEDAMMCSFVDELLNEEDNKDACTKPIITQKETSAKLKEHHIEDVGHELKKVLNKDEDIGVVVEEQSSKLHQNESKMSPKKLATSPLKRIPKLQSPVIKTTDFLAFNSDTDTTIDKKSSLQMECSDEKNDDKTLPECPEAKDDNNKSLTDCAEESNAGNKSLTDCSENINDERKSKAKCTETTEDNIRKECPEESAENKEDDNNDSKVEVECINTTKDNNTDEKVQAERVEPTEDNNVDKKSSTQCADKKSPQKEKISVPEGKVYTDSKGSKRRKLCRVSMDKSLDDLISRKMMQAFSSDDDESDDDYGPTNEYIDDQAMEGEEDTPSEDSNEIIDEGESLHSSESENDDDEDYEKDSFIDDDESIELLSGNEYDLNDSICPTGRPKKKRSRIIAIPSSSEDSDDGIEISEEVPAIDKNEIDNSDKQYKVKILQDIPIGTLGSQPTIVDSKPTEETKAEIAKADEIKDAQPISENKKVTGSPEKEVRRTSINYQDKIKVSEIHEKDIGGKITNMVEFIVDQMANKEGAQVSLNVSLDVANPASPGDSPLRPIRSPGCKRTDAESENVLTESGNTKDEQSSTKKEKRSSITRRDSIISFSDEEVIPSKTKKQKAQLSHSLIEFAEPKKKSRKNRLSLEDEFKTFERLSSETQSTITSTSEELDVPDREVSHTVTKSIKKPSPSKQLIKDDTSVENVKKAIKKHVNVKSNTDDITNFIVTANKIVEVSSPIKKRKVSKASSLPSKDMPASSDFQVSPNKNNLISTEEVSPIKKNKLKKTHKKPVDEEFDTDDVSDFLHVTRKRTRKVSSPVRLAEGKRSASTEVLSSTDFHVLSDEEIEVHVAPRKVKKLKKLGNKAGKEDITISSSAKVQAKTNKLPKADTEPSISKSSFPKQDVHARAKKTKALSKYMNDIVVEVEKNPQASAMEVQRVVAKPKHQKKKKVKLVKPSSASASDDWNIQGTAVAKPSKKNKVKSQVEKLRSKFAPNDFKNRMLYDSNIARMVSADILKNKKNGKYVE